MWPEHHMKGGGTKLSWRCGQRANGRQLCTAWLRSFYPHYSEEPLLQMAWAFSMERGNYNNVASATIQHTIVRTQRKGDSSVSGVRKALEKTPDLTKDQVGVLLQDD